MLNNKIVIFITIILIVSCSFCWSIEYKNCIEMTVGGAFSHSFVLNYFTTSENTAVNNFLYKNNFKLSIPLGMTYYFGNIFGLGFLYRFGYSMPLEFGNYPNIHEMSNELKLTNKFLGKKGIALLMEYGAILIRRFHIIGPDLSLYYLGGPTLLIGFEVKGNPRFIYAFGGIFEAQFTQTKFTNSSIDNYICNFLFGLEYRFSFSNIITLKKKEHKE